MSELWEKFQSENQFRFEKNLLQCISCNQLLTPPIYLTANAGNICHTCKGSNNIDAIRNEALEAAIGKAQFPCKYAANGCDELLKHDNLLVHQLLCHYAPMKCPNCKKDGFSYKDILEHCEEEHGLENDQEKRSVELQEYSPNDGVQITLRKLVVNDNDFIVKVTQMQWDVLHVIVCCPKGIKLNQELVIRIITDIQEIRTKAKIVECWNMLNSTDINHVTTIYLTELQKTPHGTTNKISLELMFNNIDGALELQDTDNFRKDIECPICFNYFTEKIYKCQNAHTICHSCKVHITTCPVCRVEMGDARDLRLENTLPQITMFCMNKQFGCLFESGLKFLKEHELNCVYHQFNCHIENCQFEATQLKLIEHYQNNHSMYANGALLKADLGDDVQVSIVYKNHIFFLESSMKENNYVWKVSLINSTALSWQYVYTIQVLDSSNTEAFMLNTSCGNDLSVDINLIKNVCNLDESLKMKCYIRKLSYKSTSKGG